MHKKRSYRLKLPIKIGIVGKDKSGLHVNEQCPAINVSRDGACLVSQHQIPRGSILIVSVAGQVQGKAEVIWSEGGHNAPPHRLGIKFLEMDEWIVK